MRLDHASADRLSAIVFFALGAAMLAGGYVMDRLEIRQIHPASIPGLVPMILGAALALCALLLFACAKPTEPPSQPQDASTPEAASSLINLGLAAALSVAFAVGLVGRAPFLLSTALYVAAFVAVFTWPVGGAVGAKLRTLAIAAVFGAVVAAVVAAVFRYGFLVRLP